MFIKTVLTFQVVLLNLFCKEFLSIHIYVRLEVIDMPILFLILVYKNLSLISGHFRPYLSFLTLIVVELR